MAKDMEDMVVSELKSNILLAGVIDAASIRIMGGLS